MKEHARLIEGLGDGTVVAAQLSERSGKVVDREAVYKWKVNGVPWRWRPHITAMANKKGIQLPQDFRGDETGVA
jgi:hypothetical protein